MKQPHFGTYALITISLLFSMAVPYSASFASDLGTKFQISPCASIYAGEMKFEAHMMLALIADATKDKALKAKAEKVAEQTSDNVIRVLDKVATQMGDHSQCLYQWLFDDHQSVLSCFQSQSRNWYEDFSFLFDFKEENKTITPEMFKRFVAAGNFKNRKKSATSAFHQVLTSYCYAHPDNPDCAAFLKRQPDSALFKLMNTYSRIYFLHNLWPLLESDVDEVVAAYDTLYKCPVVPDLDDRAFGFLAIDLSQKISEK